MKNYKVNIDFKKGPSASIEVKEADESRAKSVALAIARAYGFDAPVKKITVTEEVTA